MKKTVLVSSLAIGIALSLSACHKINPDENQQPSSAPTPVATQTQQIPQQVKASSLPVVKAPEASASTASVPATSASVASSSAEVPTSLFGQTFKVLIEAIKKDTANGAIPPSPDDAYIIHSIDALTPDERLNLFKVIYVRAAENENKSSDQVTPDTYQKAPLTPETPGDEVLQGLAGGR